MSFHVMAGGFAALVLAATALVAPVSAQTPEPAALPALAAPRVFLIYPEAYVRAKQSASPQMLAKVKSEAAKAMQTPLLSVTIKPQTPPSGDKHDYLSMAIYWWPDPKNPNGPYISRDGEHNPEVTAIPDFDNLTAMIAAVHPLALSYYMTGNEEHAARAAELIRTWFLDPATAMNPNLNYAQGIKGINDGRAAGIIETHNLPFVIDAAGLLAGSKAWTAADDAGLRQWFTRFHQWMITAPEAIKEDHTANNHGSWFQAQITPIELYLGLADQARARLTLVQKERIPNQIKANGEEPLELRRTNSYFYSFYNLQALSIDAAVGLQLGIDLYQPAKRGGPTILTALDALLPYDLEHPWPHEQIKDRQNNAACWTLYYAEAHVTSAKYEDALQRFACKRMAYGYVIGYSH
jgi:hypothetical protein